MDSRTGLTGLIFPKISTGKCLLYMKLIRMSKNASEKNIHCQYFHHFPAESKFRQIFMSHIILFHKSKSLKLILNLRRFIPIDSRSP